MYTTNSLFSLSVSNLCSIISIDDSVDVPGAPDAPGALCAPYVMQSDPVLYGRGVGGGSLLLCVGRWQNQIF